MKLSDPELLRSQAFVNGQWVVTESASTFEVLNPATSKPIASLPDLTEIDCSKAVDAAVIALVQLRKQTGAQRAAILRKWYELTIAAREDLAAIITLENGKTLAEARGEVTYAADFLNWFSGEACRVSGSTIQSSNGDNRVITIKQPVGVVAMITPWNFPAAMITRKVAPAFAAGCSSIVKPAAETPLTALAFAELGRRAGLPAGALNIITTSQNTIAIGKLLTTHPEIRKFSFTGSTAVGKLLAAQCTSTVKRVSLELGGNAPVIVFDDANLDKAVEGILASKFRLSGQTCVCANRVFVQAGVYNKLAEAVTKRVSAFKLGDGGNPESTHGPLITPQAAEKVHRHVRNAIDLGAKSLIGGNISTELGDAFYQPTVLVNVSPDSLCANEETFGPLLPLIKFETEEDVMRMTNSTAAGLAGYFFTENLSRAWRIAEAMEVGMVGVNTGLISDVASPFGGVKESGIGREGSSLGIEEFLEVKSVTFNTSP